MSVENINNPNSIDCKNALEKGNVNLALDGLLDKTQETFDLNNDCFRIGLEVSQFGEEDTKSLCNIFDNFYNLQNSNS